MLVGVGVLLVVQARAELPRLGRHAVGIRSLFAVFIVHGVVAPCAVVVGRDERTGGIKQRNDVTLRVEDVVVERRGRAVVVDYGERLVAVVIHELEGLP